MGGGREGEREREREGGRKAVERQPHRKTDSSIVCFICENSCNIGMLSDALRALQMLIGCVLHPINHGIQFEHVTRMELFYREYTCIYSVAVYQKYLTRLGELIIFEPWRENYHFSQPG